MTSTLILPQHSCSHLADLDGEEEKEIMLRRYKTVITWRMDRLNQTAHPAKRRRVRVSCHVCILQSLNVFLAHITDLRRVWSDVIEAVCVFTMHIYRMLGRSHK